MWTYTYYTCYQTVLKCNPCNTALHCRPLYTTALHCITLQGMTLHYTALYCTPLYCTTMHSSTHHFTGLLYTALLKTAIHCTAAPTSPMCARAGLLHCVIAGFSGLRIQGNTVQCSPVYCSIDQKITFQHNALQFRANFHCVWRALQYI